MNIVGVLVWADESASWLGACVAGFARVCDTIVAVDGMYALYPGARPRSHPDQAYAIQDACEALDVGCLIHRPKDVFWGNEVEKRQLSLELARPFCNQGSWILVFDSDHLVMRCNPDVVRWELENTDCLAATYTLLDGEDLQLDEFKANYALTAPVDTEWTYRSRGLYRWTDDLTYGPAHWTMKGTYDGVPQWVFGPEKMIGETAAVCPAMDLEASLVVVHRRNRRPLRRRNSADQFYKLRDALEVELIPEGTFA